MLCFHVEVDCTTEQAIAAAIRAEHPSFEFVLTFATPKFTYDGIDRFLREINGEKGAHEIWDEGSLVAVVLPLAFC